jgi:mRNA interferase YafQ
LNQFKQDLKLAAKHGFDLDLLYWSVTTLTNEKELPVRFKNYDLTGVYKGFRECRVRLD